jgi:hypothetical protein
MSDPTPPDRTDVDLDRLRRTLRVAPVATLEIDDGLADLRARTQGRGATPLPAPPPTSSGTDRGRLLAVAAVLVLVAGVASALVLTRGGDDDRPAVRIEPPATGWYIPHQLPKGWELASVDSDFMDVEGFGGRCPCVQSTWVHPDGRRIAVYRSASSAKVFRWTADASDGPPEEVTLVGSVKAQVFSPIEGRVVVGWVQDRRRTMVTGQGTGRADALLAARRIARGEVGNDDSPLRGYHLLDRATAPDGVRAYESITVTLRNRRAGATLGYTLTPNGFGASVTSSVLGDLRAVHVPGQPRPLLQSSHITAYGDEGSGVAYSGRWPGADVFIGDDGDSLHMNGRVTDREVRAVISALRPASADEWARFLRRVPQVDHSPNLAVSSIDALNKPGHAITPDN